MKNLIQQRLDFNRLFGIQNNQSPRPIAESEYCNQFKLMLEQILHYRDAAENRDVEEIAKCIGEILYTTAGMVVKHGLHSVVDNLMDEIHKSNISKLPHNGVALTTKYGKILKPDTYLGPDMAKVLKKRKYQRVDNQLRIDFNED